MIAEETIANSEAQQEQVWEQLGQVGEQLPNLSSPSLYTVAPQYTLYEHVRRYLPELSIVALKGSSHNHLAEHRVRLLTIAHNISRGIRSITGKQTRMVLPVLFAT